MAERVTLGPADIADMAIGRLEEIHAALSMTDAAVQMALSGLALNGDSEETQAKIADVARLTTDIIQKASGMAKGLAPVLGIQIEPVAEDHHSNGTSHEPEGVGQLPAAPSTGATASDQLPADSLAPMGVGLRTREEKLSDNPIIRAQQYGKTIFVDDAVPDALPEGSTVVGVDPKTNDVFVEKDGSIKKWELFTEGDYRLLNAVIGTDGYFSSAELEEFFEDVVPYPFGRSLNTTARKFEEDLGLELVVSNDKNGRGRRYRRNPNLVFVAKELTETRSEEPPKV